MSRQTPMEEASDEYLERLLELKEDRCRRLQQLISLKEARLAQLRSSSQSAASSMEERTEATPEPPRLQRNSSSLVPMIETARNSAPLGKLQPGGRRDYAPTTLVSTKATPTRSYRAALQRTGLPKEVVRLWHSGHISADLAMREILDAVCRCSPSSASPEVHALRSTTPRRHSIRRHGPSKGLSRTCAPSSPRCS